MEGDKKFNINEVLRSDSETFFEVDGIEYSIEELSVEEEIKHINLYVDEEGKPSSQLSSIFELTNLKKVPFTNEHINQVIKINKNWMELELPERMKFLKKLKSDYLSKLIMCSRKTTNKSVVEAEIKNC